mmetsp:Transcript_21986/g.25030  ORF Transcript_21986/g.25030 Transcript_21986/m.25030 type:complete len:85 (-) Transcript_21986:70-324(-)
MFISHTFLEFVSIDSVLAARAVPVAVALLVVMLCVIRKVCMSLVGLGMMKERQDAILTDKIESMRSRADIPVALLVRLVLGEAI